MGCIVIHISWNFQLAVTMAVLLFNKDITWFSLPLSVFAFCYVVQNAPFWHKEMQQFNHDIHFTLKFKLEMIQPRKAASFNNEKGYKPELWYYLSSELFKCRDKQSTI